MALRSWTLSSRPCFSTSSLLFASVHKPSSRLSNTFFTTVKQNTASSTRSRSIWTWNGTAAAWRTWRPPSTKSLHEYLTQMSWRTRAGTYRSRPSVSSSSSTWRGRLLRSPGDPPLPRGSGGGPGRGPLEGLRRWFNLQPPELLVWTIIGLNAGIYFAWQFAMDQMVSACLSRCLYVSNKCIRKPESLLRPSLCSRILC